MNKYTLHKLPEGFIITSDEEILPNTLYMNNGVLFTSDSVYNEGNNPNNSNPIVTDYNFKVIAKQDQIDFSTLSEEEQREIGWFDVEKISYNWLYDNEENMPKGYPLKPMEYGFQQGFQKAQELLSDRKFSLEEMYDLLDYVARNPETKGKFKGEIINDFILSQPKSWSVELEMTCGNNITDSHICTHKIPKLTNGKIKITKIL